MTPTVSASRTDRSAELPHVLFKPIWRLMPELSYYTLVSAVALTVDVIIFYALTRGGMRAALAGIAGYGVGLVVHYVLSRRFVFVDLRGSKSPVRRFVEFVVSGLIGLALTWGMIAIAVDGLQLPPLIGKIAAVAVSFVVVFMLRKGIVFADRAAADQR